MSMIFRTFLAAPIALLLVSILFPNQASAAISDWQRGASMQPSSPTSFSNEAINQSLRDLKSTNADYINYVVPLYQDNLKSNTLAPGGDTPTDESLRAAIDIAHAQGLKVSIKPHAESKTKEWRAMMDPTDRAAWFRSYGDHVKRLARIAEEKKAEQFIIGTELIHLTADDYHPDNTRLWRQLIAEVRTIYSGKIMYAANWGTHWADEKNRIAFWDAVDIVGIDAYYPISSDMNDTSVESFKARWAEWDRNDIKPFIEKVKKPVVFSEIGYRSTNGGHLNPGDWLYTNGVNEEVQRNAYEALFSYWNDKSHISGMHMWNWQEWSEPGAPAANDYTPQNKLAEETMRKWFGLQGTVNATPATSDVFSFESRTTIDNPTIVAGQSRTIATTIKNLGPTQNGLNIDIEVYQNGQQVFQKVFEGQTISGNSEKRFDVPWTPTSGGNYVVKVGIFNLTWSKSYLWQDAALTLSGGTATPAPVQSTANTTTSAPAPTPAASQTQTQTQTQPSAPAATITATAKPGATAPVGGQLTYEAGIKNTSANAAAVLIDFEVYDSAGRKVFQKVLDREDIKAGETRTYPLGWKADTAGTYTLKIGVFSPDWSKLYVWNDAAAVAKVETSVALTSTPTAAPTAAPVVATPGSCSGAIPTNAFRSCY